MTTLKSGNTVKVKGINLPRFKKHIKSLGLEARLVDAKDGLFTWLIK